MKLHIFNPDHDLALAANQKIFTAPHAGRLLRGDLSFIPALWADDGDLVLVDDIDNARDKVRHLCGYENQDRVEFVFNEPPTNKIDHLSFLDSLPP